MLTHVVFFTLKDNVTPADRARFESALDSLLTIPGSLRAVTGTPAATEPRPVVRTGYHYALELDFPDVAAHDLYQEHPIHTAFVDGCKDLWAEVAVYDFQQR